MAALALSAAGDEAARAAALERQISDVARQLADEEIWRLREELDAFKSDAERRIQNMEKETLSVLQLYETRLQIAYDEIAHQQAQALRGALDECGVSISESVAGPRGLEEALAVQAQISAHIREALQPMPAPSLFNDSSRAMLPASFVRRSVALFPSSHSPVDFHSVPVVQFPQPAVPSLHLPLMQGQSVQF